MVALSVHVQNKLSVAEKVIASARTHGPKIAAIIAERAKAIQGPDTKATVEAIMAVTDAIADGLAFANTVLRNSELDYYAEKADDAPVRTARDLSVTRVASVLAQLRTTIEGTLGGSAAFQYGIVGDIPRRVSVVCADTWTPCPNCSDKACPAPLNATIAHESR